MCNKCFIVEDYALLSALITDFDVAFPHLQIQIDRYFQTLCGLMAGEEPCESFESFHARANRERVGRDLKVKPNTELCFVYVSVAELLRRVVLRFPESARETDRLAWEIMNAIAPQKDSFLEYHRQKQLERRVMRSPVKGIG